MTTIDDLLQLRYVFPCHLRHVLELLARHRHENPAEVEQFILDPPEIPFELLGLCMPSNHFGIHHPHNPDHRIQLIKGA